MAPQKQWLSQKMVQVEGHSRGYMKEKSLKVPALKDLLDRPLDLGCLELIEQTLKDAGFGGGWSPLTDILRSLKRHSSSPERVLDLLCFLFESNDEKMQKMDLDDITMEHLTAGHNALQEVIGNVELAVKKGNTWNCRQVAPWLRYFLSPKWLNWVSYLGSKDLPKLRAMEARASILMMRLEQEAQKENDTSLKEASLNTKPDELHTQVKELTHECQNLKEEEPQRQAVTLQMQQLQLECENLRRRKEENESECLKEEESQRQAVTLQMKQLQLECENLRKRQEEKESERLKEEESKRQEHALQMQQLQLECENLRKRQEEYESERLKEEESKRQEHALQMQQMQSECESLRTKQDELHMQVQQLTHECERLKEEESQRQAVTLQLQQLQLECENLRKRKEENESECLKEEEPQK